MPRRPKSYSKADVARFQELGDVTENGVTFDCWMMGSSGMDFCLLQQSHHTRNDIELAKRYLRRDRDVIRITVAEVDPPADDLSARKPSGSPFSY